MNRFLFSIVAVLFFLGITITLSSCADDAASTIPSAIPAIAVNCGTNQCIQ